MALCDEMEARLTAATDTRRALLQATLQEAARLVSEHGISLVLIICYPHLQKGAID